MNDEDIKSIKAECQTETEADRVGEKRVASESYRNDFNFKLNEFAVKL